MIAAKGRRPQRTRLPTRPRAMIDVRTLAIRIVARRRTQLTERGVITWGSWKSDNTLPLAKSSLLGP
ncbi:hypothetical protein F441_04852 [Phytophthora nicotianae CJ01A1]|uniref:Uncharacterized protein n=4 Tax=Phytophthora nicotianae TaxID=4792 RepID=V9FL87_PHYNI|nr:hypothetical protein F443_04855 [Phytophthora nicotianae P1569]ETK91725.1 hypothetical protein L915_04721 [Phytophthora nicotianae]ETO80588.1 hypothetical protein F444_04893 [Phytophthora nicotianae P1976]ETP21618.1 hypothetical protein F441_04852 [Phytophthora nicotianae CJ01A1]ETL45138.1 hypothetical protein L916_04683 [Phytophthora nicotianae]